MITPEQIFAYLDANTAEIAEALDHSEDSVIFGVTRLRRQYDMLTNAAIGFVIKVETGKARSKRSYAAFKEALRQ